MKKTVAIVDDEPIVRMDLCDMLTELGYTVVGQGSDGFDGVELCRTYSPDLVLMDVKMPVFDGLSAAETILKEDLATAVVLLTAFCDSDIVQRATQAGVSGYLVKPVEQSSLAPTLEVAYAQRMQLRQSHQQTQAAQLSLQQMKEIHQAQLILAKQNQCSEKEAYELMRRMAMDKRLRVATIAHSIVQQPQGQSVQAQLKDLLAQRRGYSEEQAYRYIKSYAQQQHITPDQATSKLLPLLQKEG